MSRTFLKLFLKGELNQIEGAILGDFVKYLGKSRKLTSC